MLPDVTSRPLHLAIVNDYTIVVAGLASVLEPYSDRVRLVELDSGMPASAAVDVVLYDSFGQPQGELIRPDDLLAGSLARLVVFSWNTQPELVEGALSVGVAGYLTKGMPVEDLVVSLEQIAAGETVVPAGDAGPGDDAVGRWPGDDHGLSARESEVLALVCQGDTNEDIARRAFLSLSTVKTHLRTVFRKLGVENRTQAALWGVDHGFRPDRARIRPEGDRG
jgi:NarL family two-component system response regulator LiaR